MVARFTSILPLHSSSQTITTSILVVFFEYQPFRISVASLEHEKKEKENPRTPRRRASSESGSLVEYTTDPYATSICKPKPRNNKSLRNVPAEQGWRSGVFRRRSCTEPEHFCSRAPHFRANLVPCPINHRARAYCLVRKCSSTHPPYIKKRLEHEELQDLPRVQLQPTQPTLLRRRYIFQMDSFFNFFSFTSTKEENPDPVASLPTNEETGGGGGNDAYCVIA